MCQASLSDFFEHILLISRTVKINFHSSDLPGAYLGFHIISKGYHSSLQTFSFTIGNTLLNTNSKYYVFPDKTECVSKINYHTIKDIQNYIYHFSKAFIIFILENILKVFIFIFSGLDKNNKNFPQRGTLLRKYKHNV